MSEKISHMHDVLYRQIDAVCSSDLKLLAKNPRMLYLSKQKRDEPTPDMEFGTMFHMAILETEKFRDTYVCEPDRMPDGRLAGIGDKKTHINRNTTEWKEFIAGWREQNKGKEFADPKSFSKLIHMINAVARNKKASSLLQESDREMATLWVDPVTKLKCKGKADLLGSSLVDFKTTSCRSPREFERDCFYRLVHFQMAFYSWGFGLSGYKFDNHFVIGVEKDDRQELNCYVMQMSEQLLERGHATARKLLDKYAKCKATGEWPGYDEIYTLDVPAWAITNSEEEIAI